MTLEQSAWEQVTESQRMDFIKGLFKHIKGSDANWSDIEEQLQALLEDSQPVYFLNPDKARSLTVAFMAAKGMFTENDHLVDAFAYMTTPDGKELPLFFDMRIGEKLMSCYLLTESQLIRYDIMPEESAVSIQQPMPTPGGPGGGGDF